MFKKAKGFNAKYGVTLSTMNAFIRSAAAGRSGKIEHRIRRALEFHGLPVHGALQSFCVANHAFILQKATAQKKAAPVFKVPAFDPKTDEFLTSYAWRALRMKVLRKYGPQCMCCGATPGSGAVMNVDHIKPRRLFPMLALEFDNLQVLCHECNHGKGNWDQTDWRPPSDAAQILRDIARESTS